MAIQESEDLRNTRAASIGSALGSHVFEIRSGPPPASTSSPSSGTLLVAISLNPAWMGEPENGVQLLSQEIQATILANGIAGHFRFVDDLGCHLQGTVTDFFGDGDLRLTSTQFNQGATFRLIAGSIVALAVEG